MVNFGTVVAKLPTKAIRGAGPSKGRPKGHPIVHSMVKMVAVGSMVSVVSVV